MTDQERSTNSESRTEASAETGLEADDIRDIDDIYDGPSDGPEDDDDYSYPLSYRRESDQYYQPPQRKATIPEKPPEQFRELPKDEGFTVSALVEGAMMVAVSLLLAVIGIYLPVLSFVGLLLYPLPMAILTLRRGVRIGITGTLALLALSALFFGIPQAVLILLQYGVLGVFLGWCLRCGRKPLFTLGLSTLIAALGMAASVALTLFISGMPLSALAEEARGMVDTVVSAYEQRGLLNTIIPDGWTVEQYVEYMKSSMVRLLPAVMIITSSVMTVLCYLITTAILRRLRYDIPRLPKFKEWRLDWRFSWGLILGLALLLYGNHSGAQWASTIGSSVLYVFAPILLVGGIAFFFWYMDAMQMSMIMRGVLIFLAVIMFSYFIWFFMTLAVLDDLIDLRGRFTRMLERRGGA